ncbi:MAG: M20/M25/M40 family metallo-hydrolase, partial [Bacteroidota bacterium]
GLPEDKMPEVIIPDVFTPANYNDPELVKRIKKSAAKAIGEENVIYAEPQMVGEDFARYGQTEDKVPTVLFWLGTVTQEKIDKGDLPGLHSPYYYPKVEESIETGISIVSQSMIDLFNAKK